MDMRKMVYLQYLTLDDCHSLTSMPYGLGQLTGLRKLSLFVVGKRDTKDYALRELNGLNELRGRLEIKLLGNEESVNLGGANLEEKQYLESLWLGGDSECLEATVVEGLKPHPNLKELNISFLNSVMFSGCMSSFTNLSKIKVCHSRNVRSIKPLDQLPSLLSLTLQWLHNLEYVSESDRVSNSSTSTPPITTFFPSLKELIIEGCGKPKGWWKINDDQVTTTTTTTTKEKAEVVLSFPRLSKLDISHFPELTCMPLYPNLEALNLYNSSTKTLQQTMKMKINADVDAAGTSTSYYAFSAPALSNLRSLLLLDVNDLGSWCKESILLWKWISQEVQD
ncbi:NBS-LRR disease resistance protein [Melia azedarach]|uniref:NBS-LRR disease resistance protein n=1 Tax=Melia azedarach TaxID=155640 RepID=A0ACC1XWF3_MELAZ|nr:NBS-LRR disease resistance protein [Melia azedarach]